MKLVLNSFWEHAFVTPVAAARCQSWIDCRCLTMSYRPPLSVFTRRQMIHTLGGGLGALALAGLADAAPHYRPRAKRIIHLFMNGGPFGPDLFDPKPALNQYAGQRPKAVELRTENQTGGLMPVPFKYRKCGRSGLEISELLPHLATCADDLCVLR